eukprot:scaffold1513_cov100-Amphora_coffeaeformis.AAC.26
MQRRQEFGGQTQRMRIEFNVGLGQDRGNVLHAGVFGQGSINTPQGARPGRIRVGLKYSGGPLFAFPTEIGNIGRPVPDLVLFFFRDAFIGMTFIVEVVKAYTAASWFFFLVHAVAIVIVKVQKGRGENGQGG